MPDLPDRPGLDQLRRQARELLRAAADGQPEALARLRAVSDRVTLSAAQLAVAREYGFSSWPLLRSAAGRRREQADLDAAPADAGRWSLGGGTDLEIALGVLSPGALMVGPGHAAMDASLLPAADLQPRLQVAGAHRSWFDDVTITDNRGARYALRVEAMSVPASAPGHDLGPVWMRLLLDPVPARGCAWLDLRGPAGPAVRLRPSARPQAVWVTQLEPPADPRGERELPDRDLSLTELPPGDGLVLHLDIGAVLPAIGGIILHLDSLVSGPGTWRVCLRARPRWFTRSEDGNRKWAAASVHARDNLGGRYASVFGGSTGHRDHEELALRFRPRLDPLARSVRLTLSGVHAGGGAVVDIDLPPAATP